jgi:hypothetical protein
MKTTVFWDVAPCSLENITEVSEVLAVSIIRAMSKPHAKKRMKIRGRPDKVETLSDLPG